MTLSHTINIHELVKIASTVKPQTRNKLISEINEPNYYRLCRLGIITEGATIDCNDNRIAVWKFTNRADIFKTPSPADFTIEDRETATAIVELERYMMNS